MIKDKKVFEFSITPILTIILGLSFLIWQGQVIITFNKIIGGMLILIGAFNYVKCLINKKNAGEISGRNSIFATFFLILIVLGLFLYFFADGISRFIPIILGVFLFIHGAETVSKAFYNRDIVKKSWVGLALLGFVTAIAGISIVVLSGTVRDISFMILGAILVYDGISSIFVEKRIKVEKDNIIDVDTEEIDE